MQNFVSVYSI